MSKKYKHYKHHEKRTRETALLALQHILQQRTRDAYAKYQQQRAKRR